LNDKREQEANMKKSGLMLLVPPLLVSLAWAEAGPSLERGKELFNSAKLGTNGKSCATCHRDGKNLEKAAAYSNEKLRDIINQCIKNPLEGDGLASDSSDMKSLIIYLRSLADSGKGKK